MIYPPTTHNLTQIDNDSDFLWTLKIFDNGDVVAYGITQHWGLEIKGSYEDQFLDFFNCGGCIHKENIPNYVRGLLPNKIDELRKCKFEGTFMYEGRRYSGVIADRFVEDMIPIMEREKAKISGMRLAQSLKSFHDRKDPEPAQETPAHSDESTSLGQYGHLITFLRTQGYEITKQEPKEPKEPKVEEPEEPEPKVEEVKEPKEPEPLPFSSKRIPGLFSQDVVDFIERHDLEGNGFGSTNMHDQLGHFIRVEKAWLWIFVSDVFTIAMEWDKNDKDTPPEVMFTFATLAELKNFLRLKFNKH